MTAADAAVEITMPSPFQQEAAAAGVTAMALPSFPTETMAVDAMEPHGPLIDADAPALRGHHRDTAAMAAASYQVQC